jgi:hypothetical protein
LPQGVRFRIALRLEKGGVGSGVIGRSAAAVVEGSVPWSLSFEEQRARRRGRRAKPERTPEPDPLPEILLRHSYAFNFIAGAIEYLVEQWRPQEPEFRYEIVVRGERVLMNGGQADHDEVEYARRLRRGEISLSLWAPALEDFAKLAAERGFLPVVSYIPAAYTANAATVTSWTQPSAAIWQR